MAEMGMPGPHKVLHHPVDRDEPLGASIGQGQLSTQMGHQKAPHGMAQLWSSGEKSPR